VPPTNGSDNQRSISERTQIRLPLPIFISILLGLSAVVWTGSVYWTNAAVTAQAAMTRVEAVETFATKGEVGEILDRLKRIESNQDDMMKVLLRRGDTRSPNP